MLLGQTLGDAKARRGHVRTRSDDKAGILLLCSQCGHHSVMQLATILQASQNDLYQQGTRAYTAFNVSIPDDTGLKYQPHGEEGSPPHPGDHHCRQM